MTRLSRKYLFQKKYIAFFSVIPLLLITGLVQVVCPVCEGSGYVSYAAFGSEEEELFEGECGPGTIGCYYDITTTAGSYTIRVNVGITEEGEIVILSYQIQ